MDAKVTKPQGSFGVPAEMLKQMEEARNRPKEAEAAPVAETPAADEKPAEAHESKEAEFRRVKQDLVNAVGFELTPEDMKSYIFKGRLQKDVVVIPDILTCTIRTTTPKDGAAIDEKLSAFRDAGKFTTRGLENEEAILTLSYCLVAMNGKPLAASEDPDKRAEAIRSMGDHIVDMILAKMRELSTLLRLTLSEKQIVKKS